MNQNETYIFVSFDVEMYSLRVMVVKSKIGAIRDHLCGQRHKEHNQARAQTADQAHTLSRKQAREQASPESTPPPVSARS